MKIEVNGADPRKCEFCQVGVGEVFHYDSNHYLKVKGDEGSYAIRLVNGTCRDIPAHATVVIKDAVLKVEA